MKVKVNVKGSGQTKRKIENKILTRILDEAENALIELEQEGAGNTEEIYNGIVVDLVRRTIKWNDQI